MRFRLENLKGKPIRKQERICHAEAVLKSKKTKHRVSPFNESPAVEHRVFKAVFPDIAKTQINEVPSRHCLLFYFLEEWRIHMPAMQVLFLSVYLALYVKLRCKYMREDYPPHHVPHHISKILELDILSSSFHLSFYTFDINLSFIVSPLFAWVPDNVMQSITESLVATVMDDVKLDAVLLADYDKFKTEKLKT
ncbi:hypothetical protein D8674_018313 [Pyrus ussuriensis x Pyrus communis]|uniref:Uncharacterized protein n=1 Tax=Pyrus ussuriensis x Pyrus communis TaxID=2448454 RepID=A0A5N5G943_9ROSA|nr:hypothetical protein D8674_018313 [Pyrus ussuriensis x Pyrus communis]